MKPVRKSRKPVRKSRKPVRKSRKPVLKSRKPVLKSRKPVLKSRKPVLKSRKPVLKSRKPVLKSGKPVLKSRKPVRKSRKPVRKSRKPVLKSRKPVLKSRKPVLKSRKPVLKSRKAAFGAVNPSPEQQLRELGFDEKQSKRIIQSSYSIPFLKKVQQTLSRAGYGAPYSMKFVENKFDEDTVNALHQRGMTFGEIVRFVERDYSPEVVIYLHNYLKVNDPERFSNNRLINVYLSHLAERKTGDIVERQLDKAKDVEEVLDVLDDDVYPQLYNSSVSRTVKRSGRRLF